MPAHSGGRTFQTILLAILGVAVVGSTLAVMQQRDDYAFFDPLIETKAVVTRRFVEPPDEAAMQAAAIQGMLETLNDPYTFYIPPEDLKEFTKDLLGEYVGIGVSIILRDDWVTVLTPLDGSPAIKAGVMADDRIVEIEGQSTLGFTLEQAAAMLTGEPGTEVSFVVERGSQRIPITMKREKIVTTTVSGVRRVGAGSEWDFAIDPDRRIAYVRISQFNPTTHSEITAALERFRDSAGEPAGLILDFRGDPGGLLDQAVQVADLFLTSGEIVRIKGRAHEEQVFRATPQTILPDAPIALLIDGQSASASEIVTGALVENGRAVAVGTRTFGKGSVQTVHSLTGGGQLKITEQLYYLPSGRSIHRMPDSTVWGVDPSPGFYVPVPDEERTRMFLARRDRDVIRTDNAQPEPEAWNDPEWIRSELVDRQLATALEAMQARVDTGEWKRTGLDLPDDTAILGDELARAHDARRRLSRSLATLDERINQLESMVPQTEATAPADLWPDQIDVSGGIVRVFDSEGNAVATLRITSPDLEQWLIDAGLEPEGDPPGN